MSKISVILPVYNSETTIEAAVKSILSQSFKDFELIKTYCKLDKKNIDNIKNYFHKRNF